MTGKPDTDQADGTIRLNIRARSSARVDRRKLLLLATALSGSLSVIIAWSFWSTPRPRIISSDLLAGKHKARPEGIDRLPSTYAQIVRQPSSGTALQSATEPDRKPRPVTDLINGAEQEARSSALFFRIRSEPVRQSFSAGFTPAELSSGSINGSLAGKLDALSRDLDQRFTGTGVNLAQHSPGQNEQKHKMNFLTSRPDLSQGKVKQLQKPASPYTLMAGTIISASLITGLNSDLPGQVLAQVTEHVYDSVTGSHLLIPQGSRLIGKYDSAVSFAQKRALVIWQRLILPNGASISIDNLPATDASGYSGLTDQIDNHTFALIKGVALATLLNVGAEPGADREESDLVRALREAAQGNVAKAGDKIVSRHLDVQPTLKVRPGWPLRIIAARDLVLEPWHDH